MFWNLVATVFAGLGAAGIALAIRSITLKKAPKWIIPVFAGLGMMAYQVYIEYTWFDHMESRLPEGALVVGTEKEQVPWRPWSYFLPQITGFTVLDEKSIIRNGSNPEILQMHLYRFDQTYGGRVSDGVYLANCTTSELVPLNNEGKPDTKTIQQLPGNDPLLDTVCG
ncbi:MAG: hypothetical protein KGY54_00025 [Oleiphilaceae bacterium]|nr:hypothetical protein [Oleiphilaceae bacterium]